MAAMIGIVLLSTGTYQKPTQLPTVAADTVVIREVRLGDGLRDALVVERPVDASEGATSSVFVVDDDGVVLRRVAISYGHAAPPLIQIVSGVSAGDRIVVSDMRAWDPFERIQLR
jgi:hypothetical protein